MGFVRPVCEYGGVAFMGALTTLLSRFDKVQKLAERLNGCVFPALQSCHATSTIGPLCKLLHGHWQLQHFFLTFVSPVTHTYSLRSLTNDLLLLSSSIQFNSLDLFRRSFIGAIPDIWAATPVELRLRDADQG